MSTSLHDHEAGGPATVVEVSDGVFAYVQPDGSWWINNTGFLVGRRGVVSVDSCSTEARARSYQAAIAKVTPSPIRTLVNTHHHGDHTFGNFVFSGASVVGHERTRAEALASGGPPPEGIWEAVEWGDVVLEPPFLTFREEVVVHVDDLAAVVRHIGVPAHTTNDSIVWLPDRRVLFSGDLVFNGGTPFVLMGSALGSLDALTSLRSYGAEVLVPGHGPVCDPRALDGVEAYLRFVLSVAEEGRAAGLSPLEAARAADLSPWAHLTDAERLVGNLHRAYADLEGGPWGRPIDVVAALTEMVEFNGGKPLRCLA